MRFWKQYFPNLNFAFTSPFDILILVPTQVPLFFMLCFYFIWLLEHKHKHKQALDCLLGCPQIEALK